MIARWDIQAIRALIQNGRSAVDVNYALRKPKFTKSHITRKFFTSINVPKILFERFIQLISVLISARINCLKKRVVK